MDLSKPRPLERATSHHTRLHQQHHYKVEDKRPEDGAGQGQAAWKALTEKYNGHTKEARRACHEKLVKMEPGKDPDKFFSILDECRDLLQEMGQTVHNKRYEDIILRALPIEYERVLTASYERRDFGLDDIRHMVHTMYVDNLSRPSNAKPVAGRGIAMQVAGHTGSNVPCTYCIGLGHATHTRLRPLEEKRASAWAPPVGPASPMFTAAPGAARKMTDGKQWCSFHRSATHSDADCRM